MKPIWISFGNPTADSWIRRSYSAFNFAKAWMSADEARFLAAKDVTPHPASSSNAAEKEAKPS